MTRHLHDHHYLHTASTFISRLIAAAAAAADDDDDDVTALTPSILFHLCHI